MQQGRTLFFFTINFPYREGESFVNNEFPFLADSFGKIVLITSSPKLSDTNLPPHVTIHSLDEILKEKSKMKYFFRNILSIVRILCIECASCSSPLFFIKNLRSYNSTLINSFICAEFITRHKEFNRDAVFYSFWMNNHALTLAILKIQKNINHFIFRVHGYDLILERWPHGYISFQQTCHRYAHKIFTVSKRSLEYFQKTYKNSHKGRTAYLGTIDNSVNPNSVNETIVLVSCSNIIPLKRLNLIIDILKNVTENVQWIHFGEGYLEKEIKEYTSILKSNINVSFKGRVTQQVLFEFYRQNHIDFFINVSDSEGLPFSIIEAVSFGIPVIATDVGGTREIVNESTGILLDENFETQRVSTILNNVKNSVFITDKFRDGVRTFWKNNFYASLIYPRFIKEELLTLDNN